VKCARINHQANRHSCAHGNLIGPIGEKHVDGSNLVRDSEGCSDEEELAISG
jgi:hypothetical protein